MATRPPPGLMQDIGPGLRRILAPNPSPMTLWGTQTFVIGEGEVAIVDPGPDIAAHARALLDGLRPGERIGRILVTHTHLDHSPLARPLAEATGARVLAFGDARAGRSPVMQELAARGLAAGGESVDQAFNPDERLGDGETFAAGGMTVEALWTPGHFGNHLSFALGDTVLTGDLVMGWASTLISPPDGDLTAFLASCAALKARGARVFHPAHGAPIEDPAARLDWLVAHRKAREAEILARLTQGPATIAALTAALYTDTPPALHPAAARNVFAHLIDLEARRLVRASPELSTIARYERI